MLLNSEVFTFYMYILVYCLLWLTLNCRLTVFWLQTLAKVFCNIILIEEYIGKPILSKSFFCLNFNHDYGHILYYRTCIRKGNLFTSLFNRLSKLLQDEEHKAEESVANIAAG